MPYVTFRQHINQKTSWNDVMKTKYTPFAANGSHCTVTRFYEEIPESILLKSNIKGMLNALKSFNDRLNPEFLRNPNRYYHVYSIPKRQPGKFRTIMEPMMSLRNVQSELLRLLESFGVFYHTSAFAYIKKRNTKKEVERHQKNKSEWFLKLDFSDFFGSITLDYLMQVCREVFPFSEICKLEEGEETLRHALSICFLRKNDQFIGLPQGTTISPFLSNLVMLPFDYFMTRLCRNKDNSHKIPVCVYTRYADDIHISSKKYFMFKPIIETMQAWINEQHAPFMLNYEKTRFGNNKGKNWILGLMLNKDNQITIGWRAKKNMRAWIHNLLTQKENPSAEEINKIVGTLNYYRMIEPDIVNQLLRAGYVYRWCSLTHQDIWLKYKFHRR